MAQANVLRFKTNRDNVRASNIGSVFKGMVPSSKAAYGYLYKAEKEIGRDGRVIVKKAWWEVNTLGPDGYLVDTHGQSPWHFTVQASLDLNPDATAISHIQ